jgi:hypothetical protein
MFQTGYAQSGMPKNVYYLSQYGAVSDADVSMNSVTFGTDNTEVIQKILDKAQENPITVYWDGKYSVTGLKVYSNTTIIAHAGCGAILRNHADKSILMNARQTFGSKKDSNIVIIGGIWNGNYYNPKIPKGAQSKGNRVDGLNACFRFYGVDNLIVRDAKLFKPATYALAAANITHVVYENLLVDVGPDPLINNDGLHIDGNSQYGVIRHCIINSHDDGIGLNADDLYLHWYKPTDGDPSKPSFYSEACAGPISDILIDDITFNSTLFGIRILSGASRVDRITMRNIKGYTQGYAVVVDNYQHDPAIVSYAGPGNIGTLNFEDFDVAINRGEIKMPNESCINISTNVEQAIFHNIKRKYFACLEPTIYIRGKNTVIGTMAVDGYYSNDTTKNSSIAHILVEGKINQLSISNASVSRKFNTIPNKSVLLSIKDSSKVNYLQFDRISTDGIASVLSNTTGTLNVINASNLIHVNSFGNCPFFLNNVNNTLKALRVSTYFGDVPEICGGSGRILNRRGDAFK